MSEVITKYKNYVQAFLLTSAAVGLVSTMLAAGFVFLSDWGKIPLKVEALQETLTRVEQQIGARDLKVVEILGDNIAVTTRQVKAGEPIWVLFYSRATINCDRDISVRFYSEKERGFYPETRTDHAVRSAVSRQYQPLHIPIKTFEGMPAGLYRYTGEIIPTNCGVYGRQPIPFSEVFEIVE